MSSLGPHFGWRTALLIVAALMAPWPAEAWGLKTHAWIAQLVIDDVLDDGMVSLPSGQRAAVPAAIIAAIRAHPERYRMGSLGPDVFPDPIVGQTTTHPGVENGWHTDDWLKHLLGAADDFEELAFVYGFAGHAAGDMFAHTYVNAYAGDIFVLSDENEVERRHFLLEKYRRRASPIAELCRCSHWRRRFRHGNKLFSRCAHHQWHSEWTIQESRHRCSFGRDALSLQISRSPGERYTRPDKADYGFPRPLPPRSTQIPSRSCVRQICH